MTHNIWWNFQKSPQSKVREKTRKYSRVLLNFCYDPVNGPKSTWLTLVTKLPKSIVSKELRKERQSSEKLKEKSDKTKKFLFKQLRACDLLSPLVDGQLKAMIGEMRFETKSLSRVRSKMDGQKDWNWTVAQKYTIVDSQGSKNGHLVS